MGVNNDDDDDNNDGGTQLQRVEQEAEAARRTLGLQTEEDKKRAQFADELERKRHVDQVCCC